jgi:hypothetical protein
MTEILSLVCDHCAEIFRMHIAQNVWCEKCQQSHTFCQACLEVHRLSASRQDHYLNQIEAQLGD